VLVKIDGGVKLVRAAKNGRQSQGITQVNAQQPASTASAMTEQVERASRCISDLAALVGAET
jgi:hypothetical protein